MRYTIVGDGELRSELTALTATLEHVEVELLGARSHHDVRDHLRQTDLFLAPSLTAASGDEEGIPVVLMEAMASALPVVSTDHAGIPELVRSGDNGVLVPENDERALVTALSELADDPDRRRQLGEAARRTVRNDFDSARLARDLEQILSRPRDR